MSILRLDDRCPRIYFYPKPWWTLGGIEGEYDGASTLTEVAGATASIISTSTYIAVCGTLPRHQPGQVPARASYRIDGGSPTIYSNPVLAGTLPQQPFLHSSLLSPSLHILTITNLGGAGRMTYVVDFIDTIPLSTSHVLEERSHVKDRPLVVTTLTASGIVTVTYTPTTTTVIQSVTVSQSGSENSSIPQGKSSGFLGSTVGGASGGLAFFVLILFFVMFLKKRRMLRYQVNVEGQTQDRTIPRPFAMDLPRIRRQASTMSVIRLHNLRRNRAPPKERQATLPKYTR